MTQCMEPGCALEGYECTGVDGIPAKFYCGEHAVKNGYCAGCGAFTIGSREGFEFGPYQGLCDNCASEAREEDEAFEQAFDPDSYDDEYDPYDPMYEDEFEDEEF